jgi:hypothetical protein
MRRKSCTFSPEKKVMDAFGNISFLLEKKEKILSEI